MRHAILVAAAFAFSAAALAADPPAPDLMHPKAPAGAKVFITGPDDGATVGPEFVVNFGVEGIALAPATDTKANGGHHHLLIDVKELPAAGAPIPNDDTHKHYGKAQDFDTLHLKSGDHTLQLELANSAHVPFEPPIVSKKITVHVR